MCRLVAYLGQDVLLEDVLVKPINSIVMQSLHARESTIPTNGDGFGLGWYTPSINQFPALFKSIFPAWNDSNLLHLTAKIKSACFFAHVRAASAGGVSHTNCHPFIHQQWMLMHNGEISHFVLVERHLRHLLDDDIYYWVKGETDSEHLFGLFLQMSKGKSLKKLSVVADILQATLVKTLELVKEFGQTGPSYFNVCLTDGKRLIATRYCSDLTIEPETMHYSVGRDFEAKGGSCHMVMDKNKTSTIIVASEKLNNFDVEWHDVPTNHLLMVDADLSIQLRPL